MKHVKFENLFQFQKKSKIKAGDGLKLLEGKYPFYTSSDTLTKSINEFLFDIESLIFGTGGQASIHYCNEKFAVSTDCFVTQPKNSEEVFLKYIYYYLSGNIYILENGFKGAGLKHISKDYLQNIEIPLPPLPQQQKIANILDAADALRQNDKALIAKYNELTQALFLDMFGDPVSNPKGWEKVELKKCTSKIGSGSTPRGGKETYLTEGIALIRSLNIYDNEFKYKNLAYISQEQADKLKNVIVERSDVLFNITGASVCRCSIVPDDVLPARVNQHVSILRPIKEKLSSSFLSHLLISENVKIKLLGVGSFGGAVMEAITKEQLEKIEVILPSIDLQNQFAERVAVIEEQKAIAQKSLEKSESLFNSLLQKAFKGELV